MKLKKIKIIVLILFLEQNIFASDVETIGDILAYTIPSAAYMTTLYLDDKEGKYQFYKSFAVNAFTTYTLKYAVDKQRPNGKKYSFPSGHTSMAFQSATFIHIRYGLKYSLLAYAGAIYVGYSRVNTKNHYISDVIAGALIGSLSNIFFTNKYNVKLLSVNNSYGVTISTSW